MKRRRDIRKALEPSKDVNKERRDALTALVDELNWHGFTERYHRHSKQFSDVFITDDEIERLEFWRGMDDVEFADWFLDEHAKVKQAAKKAARDGKLQMEFLV